MPCCTAYTDVCLSCHCRQQMFQPPPALDDSQSLLALLAQGRSSAAPALSPAQAGALKALTHSPAASQAAGFRKANKSTLAKPSNMPANCPPSQHTMSGQGAEALGPLEVLLLDLYDVMSAHGSCSSGIAFCSVVLGHAAQVHCGLPVVPGQPGEGSAEFSVCLLKQRGVPHVQAPSLWAAALGATRTAPPAPTQGAPAGPAQMRSAQALQHGQAPPFQWPPHQRQCPCRAPHCSAAAAVPLEAECLLDALPVDA